MEIHETVIALVAKVAKREASEITPERKLAEDLGLKSIGRIELAALLEDKFGKPVDNFEIRKPKTVGDVIAMVQAKLS